MTEPLPGFQELGVRIRLLGWAVVLVALAATWQLLTADDAGDAERQAAQERQAQRTDEAWRRIRADRRRRDRRQQALQDSLAALARSAAAVARARARAEAARGAIAIGGDTAAAASGDTTRYVQVTRAGDVVTHAAPAFYVAAFELQVIALDSASRQLQRMTAAATQALAVTVLDESIFAGYDELVASLQQQLTLSQQAVAGAERRGRARGRREGAAATGLLLLLLGVIVL